MKLDDKQKQAVQEYIDQVNKLKGRPSKNKGLKGGKQSLYVQSNEKTKSKKGKDMMKTLLINPFGGQNYVYTMFTSKNIDKVQSLEVGKAYECIITGVGGFLNVIPGKEIELEQPIDSKVYMNAKHVITYDVEVYQHNWSVVFEDVMTGLTFTVSDSKNKLDRFIQAHEDDIFIGYNNAGYDRHIIKGLFDNKNVYEISKEIIDGDTKENKVWKMYNTNILQLSEVDLYHDNKGFSLKEHNAFNGLEIKESDIPFDIDRELTDEEKELNEYYNTCDVGGTTVRFMQLIGSLHTKALLCELFELDYTWLFKTNANIIAEALGAVFHEDRGDMFDKYEKPDWIRFDDPEIQRQVNEWILDRESIPKVQKTKHGEKYWTTDLEYTLKLRDLDVSLGSGGLHAAILNYIVKDGKVYQDDVGSLFPNTAVNNNYMSRNIPKKLVKRYAQVLADRMEYKHKGEKAKEQAMKLILNTYYGVLRARFNKLYDPRQAIMINITGQLALLDLADKLQPYCFISAMNTDSINYEVLNEDDLPKIEAIKKDWCERSNYELDTDIITDIAQANVNNYVCKFDSGKIKRKGAISMGNGVKYSKPIVYKAVEAYFMNDVPVSDTINQADDLRDFQIISKTGYTFDYTIDEITDKEIQKVNRSFAIKEECISDQIPRTLIRKVKLGVLPEKPLLANVDESDPKQVAKYEKATETYHVEWNKIKLWAEEFGYNSSIEHWKEVNRSTEKSIQNEPEFYTISNEAISDSKVTLDMIDRDYYIEEANRMIAQYVGEVELEEEVED